MTIRATAINPSILRWARERAGFSVEDVARRLKRTPESIVDWEEGRTFPTFRQLERLAIEMYKRPVALFFFPEPPPEEDFQSKFRTLPEADFDAFTPDTRFALREALARQHSLKELTDDTNPSPRVITRDIRAEIASVEARDLAVQVRTYLDVTLDDQQHWPGGVREALRRWRSSVESAGVIVFKRSFSQTDISGFCLDDDTFPVIVINNSTSQSRQIFTLFHELAHLLYDVSGVTPQNDSYISRLDETDRQLEVACNRFAAEFLLPEAAFPWHEFDGDQPLDRIATVADRFKVSREVVLRRLMSRDLVSKADYDQMVSQWNEEYLESRKEGSGGSYYANQATYLGDSYLNIAFSHYHSGDIDLPELASHLGIKARNIPSLEDYVLRRS